jgi:long-chain acyl-CoA synthetase
MQQPWHRRYDPGVPFTFAYPDWTLPELLRRSVTRFPQHTALLFYGARLSFRELDALTSRFAFALRSLGVRPGDRVALMLPNIPQAVIGYYGALKAGAIVVQINPLYVSREIEAQLADSGSETILVLDRLYPRVAAVKDRTPLKQILVTSIRDFLPLGKRLWYEVKARLDGHRVHVENRHQVYDFLTLVKAAPDDDPVPLPVSQPDDLALLQYTGGTTGVSKGVMLSHRNVVANAFQGRYWVPDFREGHEVFLGVVPFFHVYGLSTCQHIAMMTGSTLILLPRFQASEVLRTIHTHRVTILSGIPAMFMAINEFPGLDRYDLRSLRACLSGAGPLHAEVRDRFERATGVKIAEGYGLTEAGPVTHCNPIYGDRPRESIGLPFPDTDVRIVDEETGERDLPVGETGELLVHGPQVMRGYWNNRADTDAVLRDGWLHTGDLVRRDGTGFFYLMDRKKDMIKSRGENVYPREVEEILLKHPAIKDAVVVGVPDPQLGEAIKAYIVLRDGCRLSKGDLLQHCRLLLARFKVPTAIEFRQELPRSAVGKALRRLLREEETRKAGTESEPCTVGYG